MGVKTSYLQVSHKPFPEDADRIGFEHADTGGWRYLNYAELRAWIEAQNLTITGIVEFSESILIEVVGAGAQLDISADTSQFADINLQTGLVLRWALRKNNTAEGGSNTGSNFQIKAYDDAGALLRNALQIERNTGLWTIIGDVKLNGEYRFYGTNLHNASSLPTGTTNQPAGQSGTYTPTLTNVANAGTLTASKATWMRVGNMVHVCLRLAVSPTAAADTLTRIGISLPIASSLANFQDLNGTAVVAFSLYRPAVIVGDTANDRAELSFQASATSSTNLAGTFSYEVL